MTLYNKNDIKIIKEKEPLQYVRFATCWNCKSILAIFGDRTSIDNYERVLCPKCNYFCTTPLGILHKANGWYAKRKLRKAEKNESKN